MSATKSKRRRSREHVQQELFRRGGKRRGAGRKPRDGRRRRRGKVFADRYHVEVITTPTQAHHAIRYVLCNFRKHGEDRHGVASTWSVDAFSTGILFSDWKELQDKAWMWPLRETYDPMVVRRP